MKKFYFVLSFLAIASFASAQNAAITGCKNSTTNDVEISYDYSLNCSVAPGSLSGNQEIGFHSGADQWSVVVNWDDAGATTAANDGNDVFAVNINTSDYYGVALADLTNIYFVFNQGPTSSDDPWGSEGKDEVDGACADFFVIVADLEECVSNTIDFTLANSLKVTPNPFNERATITFDNPNNKVYDITVTSLTGQVVRTFTGVNGTSIELDRNYLTAGMYFVNFVNEEGKTATTKVAVQ